MTKESLIEELEAELDLIPFGTSADWDKGHKYARDAAVKVVRQHQQTSDDLVEAVRQAQCIIAEFRRSASGVWLTLCDETTLRLAAIAAMNMGYASNRKTEGCIGTTALATSADAITTSPANHVNDTNVVSIPEPSEKQVIHSEIPVVDESDLKDIIDNALVAAFDAESSLVEAAYDAIRPYLSARKPVIVSLEKCGDALIEEMKSQNLTTDNDIAKTKCKTLVGVDGITCARRLSKAVLGSLKAQGAELSHVD